MAEQPVDIDDVSDETTRSAVALLQQLEPGYNFPTLKQINDESKDAHHSSGIVLLTDVELDAVQLLPMSALKKRGTMSGAKTFCKLLSQQELAHGCDPSDPTVYATYLKNISRTAEGSSALQNVFRSFYDSNDVFSKAGVSSIGNESKRYAKYWQKGQVFTGCLDASDGELKEIIRANGIPLALLKQAESRGDLCRLIDGYLRGDGKKVTSYNPDQFWTQGGPIPMSKASNKVGGKTLEKYNRIFKKASRDDLLADLLKAQAEGSTVGEVIQNMEDKMMDDDAEETSGANYYSGYHIPGAGWGSGRMPFSGHHHKSRTRLTDYLDQKKKKSKRGHGSRHGSKGKKRSTSSKKGTRAASASEISKLLSRMPSSGGHTKKSSSRRGRGSRSRSHSRSGSRR